MLRLRKKKDHKSIIFASTLTEKEKEEKTSPKAIRKQTHTNKQTKNRRKKQKSERKENHGKQNWFIEKINKVDKTLAR